MYITYHKEIDKPVGIIIQNLPHIVLDDKIRQFIEERGVKQDNYYFKSNNYYMFIYLDNGDRVDVQLN